MREFAREENLRQALLFGAVLTLLSIPRLLEVELALPPFGLIVFTFAAMTLASGTALAWGRHGGMAGLFPEARRIGIGLGWAAIAGLILLTIFFYVDPLLPRTLAENPGYRVWNIDYPETKAEVISRILWSGGFQTMFLTAAAMAVFSRVTRNMWIAALIVVGLRMGITAYRLAVLELHEIIPPFLGLSFLFAGSACFLFARYGLIPPVFCAVVVESRHFARLGLEHEGT